MAGCQLGRFFQVIVAGGSCEEGLLVVIQGVLPGMVGYQTLRSQVEEHEP